jgi:CBS domain containing-hemolysin-like protein
MRIFYLSNRNDEQKQELKTFAKSASAVVVTSTKLKPVVAIATVRDAMRYIKDSKRTDLAIVDMTA